MLLRSFPEGLSEDHPELALAHAAVQLAHGRLEEAADQLALAECHVESTQPARRQGLAVAIASLRLALARRSGQFTEVIEQVSLLDSSIADESSGLIAMSTELRGVALMNLGIVEMWSGRLADADRHLAEGAELAQAIGSPYLEVACLAHRCFASKLVSVATARERGERAVALAERSGFDDRPIVAPALAAVGAIAVWTGEFDEGESWLRRAWEVAEPDVDPAAAVFLHVTTGMLHAGRAATSIGAGRVRSGSPDASAANRGARTCAKDHRVARSDASSPRDAGRGSYNTRRTTPPNPGGWVPSTRSTTPAQWSSWRKVIRRRPLEALGDVQDTTQGVHAFTLVETHLLAGIAHLDLGDQNAAAAAAEAALAAAEPDRLMFPFAMTGAAELLDALPRHKTAHAALLADTVSLLREGSVPSTDRERLAESDELSPSELRVLRYLPTNLTRAEIASELYVSTNTVATHIRNIYSKLGVRDRSSAVRHARELRLLSTSRS